MDTVNEKEPAIMVDWADLESSPALWAWVSERQYLAAIVITVMYPEHSDFRHESPHPGQTALYDLVSPVVLRNSTGKPMLEVPFKAVAITSVQDMSNLQPVIAFDEHPVVRDMYREASVLLVEDPTTFDFNGK